MSGINPLIDTLLHQVLGKRVDTPPARELNEPVRPVSPSEAPRALHSDSRLEARARSPLVPEAPRPQGEPGQTPAAGRTEGATPASTQIHFTPSARSIADVLLRFPAPPSTLTPLQPLVASGESPAPAQLAERLQGSIRDSGLFYESHLTRWYRGEMPRDQLLREPQMWRTQAFTPAPASGGGEAPSLLRLPLQAAADALRGAGPGPERTAGQSAAAPAQSSPGGAPVSAGGPPGGPPQAPPATAASPSQAAAGREAAASDQGASVALETAARQARDPVHESLQGIVRHQLEMLVTPVLRWEGDVWTGLFMALVMHLPPGEQGESGREEQDEGEQRERQGWRAEITMDVAGLGAVGVSLWLRERHLDLDLTAHGADIQHQLADGADRLRARLEAFDLGEVRIRVLPAAPEAGS